jgi:hypothetical protein
MANSKMLAALIGPTFMALGGMLLLNEDMIGRLVHDTGEGPLLVAVTGMLLFIAGIAIVRVHNVWVKGWPVVVTVIGWFGMLSGLARMFFPQFILQTASRFYDQLPVALDVAGLFFIALGAFLSYHASKRG